MRTGLFGFVDVWLTKTPHTRQFAGVMGFAFTNVYVAYNYFQKEASWNHAIFKKNLANNIISYKTFKNFRLSKLPYEKPWFYCRHDHENSERVSIIFECFLWKVPLCKPSLTKDCRNSHLIAGLPQKRRQEKKKRLQ